MPKKENNTVLSLLQGTALSGEKKAKCTKAQKVQILMVYRAYREVCDQQQEPQEQQQQRQESKRQARRIKDENEKINDGEVNCSQMPASRLIYDEECRTTTVEDCVTRNSKVKKRVCPDDGEESRDKVLSRRIGVAYANKDDEPGPETAFKVIYEGGKRLREHFRDRYDDDAEAREKVGRDDASRDCRTVVEAKEEVRLEERCNTEEEERCQVHKEERCRVVREVFEERRCRIVPRKKCHEVLEREIVGHEEKEGRGEEDYLRCTTALREVCTEPQIDFYIFIEGKCRMVEEKICQKKVPHHRRHSRQRRISGPRTLCREEPSEECGIVPRVVMHKHCKQVPVDRCRKVPVKRCHKVPIKLPIEVKSRECHGGSKKKAGRNNIRPSRQHNGKICKVVTREEPRLQCSRIPKVHCEKMAKEYIGDDGRRVKCARSPARRSLTRSRTRRAQECRKVGVGRPKMVPRVSPTVICNLG